MIHRLLRRALAVAVLVIPAAAAPAAAHPHAWLENRVHAVFANRRLTRLDLHWRFDEVFSDDVLRFVKHDPARPLAPAEVGRLEREAFAGLKEYGYFTHLRAGDAADADLRPRGFRARLDGRRLVYDFSLVPARVLEAETAPLVASFYDPTYYADVAVLQQSGLTVDGAGCRGAVGPDTGHTIYNGFVTPVAATFTCAR